MQMEIRWPKREAADYMFGTRLSFEGSRVIFENPLMSPSLPIKSWFSVTNFQAKRQSPHLPLLKRGHAYRLTLEASVSPRASLYVKVSYFDRYGSLLDFEMLKDEVWDFHYPKDAFSYTVQLINAGCQHLVFERLLLTEVTTESSALLTTSQPVTIIFAEKEKDQIPKDILDLLTPYSWVVEGLEAGYLTGMSKNQLEEIFKTYPNQERRFVGYGPVGNLASLYYAVHFDGTAFVTDEWLSLSQYNLLLKEDIEVSLLLERRRYASNVVTYACRLDDKVFALVSPLLKGTQQLRALPFLRSP